MTAKITRYPIKTSKRTGEIEVEETDELRIVRITYDTYGELGDEFECGLALRPLIQQWADDPKPSRWIHPNGDEVTTFGTDSESVPSPRR